MAGRTFVDTNVLLYALARDDAGRQETAKRVLDEAGRDDEIVVSTQVMQEFHTVATGKFRRTVPVEEAELALRRLMEWTVVVVLPATILAAADRSRKDRMNFWDALVVETALHAGCDRLLSEDLQEGRLYGGLRVVNPFLP